MNKETLLKVLQLDSILEVLPWEERMKLHSYILEKPHAPPLTSSLPLYSWIEDNKWQAPRMKIGQDRMLYCFDDFYRIFITNDIYLDEHPELAILKAQI